MTALSSYVLITCSSGEYRGARHDRHFGLSEIATELARAEAATKARTEPRTHALPNLSVNKIIIKLDE